MAINKVIYDDDTLIDLTGDTVTPEKLLSGETAHNAAGNRVTGTAVKGHTIQNSSGTALTQRDAIQFKDMAVSDDSTNNKTVVRQTQVVNTEAEWNQMLANDEVDPNVTYYLPWMSTSDYAEDRTPVGTVIQVTGNYDNTTTRQKSWYPHLPDSEDYLICNGYQPRIESYPELFDYFVEVYGSGYYFNNLVPIGRFAVPDFRTDFPTNGMLYIKAKTTSTRITYAEVNDERTTENNVWSAEKVNNTKADNSVIAPVESGTTASRAYVKGAHFIRDSAFCTAKTAIAQGEAFTLNTNYTAESIGLKIKNLEEAKANDFTIRGLTYGANVFNMPSGWNEALIQVVYADRYFLNSYHLSNEYYQSTPSDTSLGNYGTSFAIGKISKETFQISQVNWAGNDMTQNSKAYIYTR